MSNYHEYDDLFASYERRNNSASNESNTAQSASGRKSTGYTSSSSYSKTSDSSSSSLGNLKKKAVAAKNKVSKSPEKSQKNYYGSSASPAQATKRVHKPKTDQSESATVKFNYSSRQAPAKTPAKTPQMSNKAFVEATKDDYRRKYDRLSQERSRKKKQPKSAGSSSGEKKEKKSFGAAFGRTFVFLIVVIACSLVLTTVAISCLDDVLAINRHSEKAVTITIDKQVDTKTVIKMLKDNDLIKNPLFCELFAKFKGYSDNYQTGVFYLKKDMGIEGMILALKATAQTEETITITFPEGYSVIDIANKLEANEVCKAKNFIDTLENYTFEYDFLPKQLKADKTKYQYLEGYLFPSTYDFYIGESPSNVIKKMLDAFNENVYTSKFKTKCEALGLDCDDVVTLASIIQREAANQEQMEQIADVLYNRLTNSSEYPRLECDSTIDFLSKDVKDYLKLYPDKGTIDYFSQYYNTYNNSFVGIPAGAICNPGLDAIKAVLDMSNTEYYYFCHDSSGDIHLATTLGEFEYIKDVYGVNADDE